MFLIEIEFMLFFLLLGSATIGSHRWNVRIDQITHFAHAVEYRHRHAALAAALR